MAACTSRHASAGTLGPMVIRRTLALARNRAAIAAGNRLYVVDTEGSAPPVPIELAAIVDVVTVGADEVWAVAGEPRHLHRYRYHDGAALGAAVPLWGDSGLLRPTALGSKGAAWSGSPEVMVASDGALTPIPAEADCVIPVSLTRWVACRRDRVVLRDPTTERWNVAGAIPTGRVVDGAVLFEGRSVALVVAHNARLHQLVVINLHDGSLLYRITLTSIDLVRFAPVRGHALLVTGAQLLIMDLRFGRVIKDHTDRKAIVDAAIDGSGQSFVLRHGDGADDITFGAIRDLSMAPVARAPEVATEPESVALETPAPAPAPPRLDFHRHHVALGSVTALAPRPRLERSGAMQSARLLACYRELVAAMLGRAIALAWDHGRLAFPNTGGLPFREEVTGILGRSAGRAIDEITASDKQVLEASAAARVAEASSEPGVSTMQALADEFDLSPLARLLLLLIAGPALWGELARLYGILGNDEERPLVDEMLLIQILAGQFDRRDVARELDRDAPLVRHGFVKMGTGRMRPFLELVCEPIVHRLLLGTNTEVELDEIRIVHRTHELDDLLIPAATKQAIVDGLASASTRARIVIRGRDGSGRHTLLATLAAAANRSLGVIDAAPIARDLRLRLGQLHAALLRAHLVGLLPCVDGLECLASDDVAGRAMVERVLAEHPGPLAVRLPWNAQPILRPGYLAIDLPVLTIEQRTACWQTILKQHGLFVRAPEEIAERYSVGPGVIVRACAQVAKTQGIDQAADRGLELENSVRQHLESRLRDTATRIERLASWSRVVLPADVQESVLELIARIKHRRTVYESWGYDQILTTARGVTALFQGGPGTGKTLVASAIANELGMDLYRVDLSRVMSKWIGETEQNLAKLFDAAEDGHAIILFDEADSLFAKRTEVRTSVDRYANLEVNFLLQRLDSFEGIAILTTNFGTAIDSAFKRRLSFRLTFPFPDEEGREALWRSHLPPSVPRTGAFDFPGLARRFQLSGGYIRNAAVRAAFLAAEEHTPLTQDHLERAIKAEFREIGKIAESGVLE